MPKHRERDLNHQKSLLVLLKLASLPGIVHRSLALFIGVLLLSECVAATPVQFSPRLDPPPVPLKKGEAKSLGGLPSIAQQPAATSQDAAAAQRIFQEGMQLYRQQTAESLRQAIAKWEQALPLYRAVGDKKQEAVTLSNIGRVYDALGEKQKALDYYNQSLPVSRAVGNRAGEAVTLSNIGRVYDDLGEKQKALDYFNQSLAVSRAVGDRAGEASTLNNIGLVYDALGEKQKALDYYNQSLPVSRAVGNRAGEAATLSNIGAVYDALGEKQKALDYYNQSLPLKRAVGDRAVEARTLNNIGGVYDDLGEKQKALDYYNQSLPLSRALGDRAGEAVTLSNIGLVYSDLGQKQKALDYFNQSLPLRRAVGDRAGEAVTLSNIGGVYDALGQKQKALDYYNQSLPLRRAVGDRAGEAVTLSNIGGVYDALGQKQKALDYFNQSLPLRRAVGDRAGEAVTLSNIGAVYDALGEKQKALDYYNQSLPVSRAVGDRAQEAVTLSNIGLVYSALGEKQKALDYYNQSLPVSRAIGDRAQEALTLSNIGAVYDDLGEKQKALDYYNQSLPVSRAVGNRAQEAVTLSNIGGVYDALGEKQKALDYYNQSLPVSRAVGDRAQEALTLNNIGLVYDALGEKQKALDYYNQSLPVSRAVGNRSVEAGTLINIGGVYFALGEKQKALDYYNQSLPVSRAVGDRAQEAVTLNNIGRVYSDLGQKQKALDYYNQSLPVSRAVGNREQEATTLSNIGAVYNDLGEKQKALDYYNQSLPLRRAVGDRAGEAVTLNNIGGVYNDLGQKQKALDYYNQSLPVSRAVGDREQEATTLGNIAVFERNRGNLNSALTQIEAALNIIEDLRTKIDNQQLRASYFATVQGYYKFKIDLLMQLHKTNPSKGDDVLALQTSERARARSLLELLTEAHANIRQGVDPKLLQQERTIQQQLDAAEQRRVQLLSTQYTDKQLADIKQQFESLNTQLEQVQKQIRKNSPRYANLKYPQPLTLQEIQSTVLDDDTLLLQYSLGEEHSYLWAVTKTSITSYSLPKRADIEAAAQSFYEQTGKQTLPERRGQGVAPGTDTASVTSQLSQMLLSPVASVLGQKRLLIVSDGALQYLPFAALPAPDTLGKGNNPVPLIVKHEIVNLPSASTLAVIRQDTNGRKPAPKTVAVLADPVFSDDDERLKTSVGAHCCAPLQHADEQSATSTDVDTLALKRAALEISATFDRLPYTRTEADSILKLAPAAEAMQAFDFAANRATATNPQLSQYRIVHFATHGILDSEHPELSGVVLSLVDEKGKSQNGFLRLNDIFNLNLPAELIVLSACKTGLGQDVKGEGLVGLTRGFMYAGAPRVLVSLWSVNDKGTSELMSRFYKKMLQEKLPPAAALRAAQIEMLQNPQWNEPYYWAAFTLQGEWK